MAITNVDQLIAGFQPPIQIIKATAYNNDNVLYYSLFYAKGCPGAAAAPTPGLAGEALTSISGQIPYTNPASGSFSYLARFECRISMNGESYLYDRLWHNSGISNTTTTAQTINSVAWPARDANGSTNGDGVLIALEIRTAMGFAAPITNTTLQYTNSAGTSGRTGTILSLLNGNQVSPFYLFSLQGGDTGVRSVQSLTLGTSYVSGNMHLVAVRRLATSYDQGFISGNGQNALTGGLPRCYDNTCPFLVWIGNLGTGQRLNGCVQFAHG